MSWGTKIAILYISFVLMIVLMVFLSSSENVDLVSADYYAQELKFQEKIDGQKNFNALTGKIECEASDKSVRIKYPKELIGKNVMGDILFYRPSDSSLDMSQKMEMDSLGNQTITNNNFKRGIYLLQIKCQLDKRDFYYEQQIFMN